MIDLGIDLSGYFQSSMATFEVPPSDFYPQFTDSDETSLIGANLRRSQHVRAILAVDVFESRKRDLTWSMWASRSRIAPAALDKLSRKEWVETEYAVVNMPMLLRQKPRQFVELIKAASDKDINILDIPVV